MNGEEILKYLPEQIEAVIRKAGLNWECMEEIRLRVNNPLLFYMNNQEYHIDYIVKQKDIAMFLDSVSGHSLYAYQDELSQGYFTLEGGHRVGVAGKTVVEDDAIKTQKYISFLNIRIAHEKKGCAKKIIGKLLENGQLKHTLIISPPGCGKTTYLRDLIRCVSDGFYYVNASGQKVLFPGRTVGVVDERSELGACVRGIPENDLGMRTDILDGCPKEKGIFLLLRSMAPKVIAVDEIGNEKDLEAIRQAVHSGCIILATAHGSSVENLSKKKVFAAFFQEGIFERYVILSGREGKGTVEQILNRGDIR